MKKFNEADNLAVITTKFVLQKNEHISYVYHHKDDGMWEFISSSDAQESDYMVVALNEITTLDPSVLKVADLEFGYYAYRQDKWAEWQIDKID
jgi:hypothetical protein